ncbi:unnamed protein product [Adineta steineri]|uniref:Uncharacterized protein n=1 Tax=Adineta steineri TaxID=433720 RepID=A0A820DK01_9BILA|nr:unnamed protein product [Adineta steineri]CAF4233654.1 unnamed protein product [Adineta steineri]
MDNIAKELETKVYPITYYLDNLLPKVKHDDKSNNDEIADSMNSLEKFIVEYRLTNEVKNMEDFQIRLQNELEILLSSNDQIKLLRAIQGFSIYINRLLNGLKITTKHAYSLEGIDKLRDIRNNIIKCGEVVETPKHTRFHNSQLEKLIPDNQIPQEWNFGYQIPS